MCPRQPFPVGLVVLLTVAVLATPAGAAASRAPAQPSACEGVRLLTAPLVVVGVGPLISSITGPADDTVVCQLIARRARPARGGAEPPALRRAGHCKNAQRPGHKLRPGTAAKAVRCLINRERTSRRLGALSPRDNLRAAAKNHSSRMVASGCFSHQCSGEPDLVGRVTQTGYLPCGCAWRVGEDLAWGKGKLGTPQSVVAAWMGSAPHRANILDPSFREVDVGVRAGRPGKRKAKAATYTANFGFRR